MHNATSGVAHFLAASEPECLHLTRRLLGFLPSNNLDDPPVVSTGDSPQRMDPRVGYHRAGACPISLRHAGRDPARRRRWRLSGGAGALGAEYRDRLCPDERALGGHRGAGNRPCWRAYWTLIARPRARAVRALLRLLQHPLGDVRGRAGGSCPAWRRSTAGIIRHGAKLLYAYCEGDGAQGDGDYRAKPTAAPTT